MNPLVSHLPAWALAYLVNSLWQAPLVLLAAVAVVRLARGGPQFEHRVYVTALLAETVLPACHVRLAELCRLLLSLWASGQTSGAVHVTLGPGLAHGAAFTPALSATALLLYATSLLYFATRLAWGIGKTRAMQRAAVQIPQPPEAARTWQRCAPFYAARDKEAPTLATSDIISGPVTAGILRPLVLVPTGFLDRVSNSDLPALLAHEYAHICRHDFAKNLAYELLTLPIAYHPLCWLTRRHVAETRELVCDAMAAELFTHRTLYARCLLRLAALSSRTPATTLHAIGIFDANAFERRVMILSRNHVKLQGLRRALVSLTCAAVACTTCASALALRLDITTPMLAAGESHAPVHVNQDNLTTTYKKTPVYPQEAKAAKSILNGQVVLAVTIGTDGVPEHISVTRSLRSDYDQSALDAVREWRWQPYRLNGQPVEVDTTVTITYSVTK
jgi:TonB family protein